MFSFAPIWAIVVRHMRVYRRDLNLLLGTIYWPLLDVLIWGFLGAWISKSQATQLPHFETAALLGILLWQVVGRGSNIMIFSLTEELLANNVVNLFSLPLRLIEWICGVILFYAIMIALTTFFCMGVISYLYGLSFSYLFSTFWLFFPPLFFSGIWLGFTAFQIIVTFGKRAMELGFIVTWFLLPFSGAYYPLDVLPQWAQTVASFLPMSHVFQGMRGYVMYQQDPTPYLMKGYMLSIPYAIIAVLLFALCFKRSKNQGLARLAD